MSARRLIRQKHSLVLILAALQLCVLVAGCVWLGTWLESRLTLALRQQVLDDNAQVAAQLGRMIELMRPANFERGTSEWTQLQEIVEGISLPNDGFVCIIGNADGRLICHPDLRKSGRTEPMSPAMAMLNSNQTQQQIQMADGQGWSTMPDGNHLIAVRNLQAFGVRVLAHQKEAGLVTAVRRMIRPVMPVGLAIAALMTLLEISAAVCLINRYENRLALMNEQLEDLVEVRTRALMKTRNAVIFGLAKLAESRDTDTGDHLDRIQSFVTILARQLRPVCPELTEDVIANLALASSLHDIGKVGVPDAILLKPGKLTSTERAEMEQHAKTGAECLSAIMNQLGEDDFLSTSHDVALCHHERFDGTGYPQRLRGREIPMSARIVALADVYDALISPRCYKAPMPHAEAREIILLNRGRHFDPVVVEAFLRSEQQFEAICLDLQTEHFKRQCTSLNEATLSETPSLPPQPRTVQQLSTTNS
ncbi:MAG: HD domain-containing protein [Planctomycetaceae bacterium]|nr:HD domain-containing protein [Planctomycetaceae bacterium]